MWVWHRREPISGGKTALNCSDETAAAIDEEVVAMIKESYDQALQMLRENRDLMDKLAAFLIERETITGKEFMEIFRREKGLPDPEEEKKDVTETNAAGSAVKGNSVDVTIGEQVMTSTDSTFQPLTFEDSLQEAKEQLHRRRIPQSSLQNPQKKRLPHRRSMNRNPQSRKAMLPRSRRILRILLRDR